MSHYYYSISNALWFFLLAAHLFISYGVFAGRSDWGFHAEYSVLAKVFVLIVPAYLGLLILLNRKRCIQLTDTQLMVDSLYLPWHTQKIEWTAIRRIDQKFDNFEGGIVTLDVAKISPYPTQIRLKFVTSTSSYVSDTIARGELVEQLHERATLAQ